MCDSANVANDLSLFGDRRIKMERERCDSHRRAIPGSHFSLRAGECPVNSGIEIAQRFQSTRANTADAPRSVPVDEPLRDKFRRDRSFFDD